MENYDKLNSEEFKELLRLLRDSSELKAEVDKREHDIKQFIKDNFLDYIDSLEKKNKKYKEFLKKVRREVIDVIGSEPKHKYNPANRFNDISEKHELF